jgi:hypothetical protein
MLVVCVLCAPVVLLEDHVQKCIKNLANHGHIGDCADGESEPNYWLGYSSGTRTDQHPPSLHPTKRDQERPT